ncbi:MAG: 2-dehydropantoate 2-reductase [Candidatus Methanofastidiosa archaeon]|nr:2-dehydropantoate 2-reductase [Candidatus Methanofastidiosa archaeon]HPC80532.1 2-dehydropantoate 2-reductase [Methanofastidiosum sp.]HRS25219.1 2-dehydropantoate 2-reductase [Methanofastidiosum sp.]
MKITFIGAGSIGSLFGGLLKKSGVDVLLIGRKDHVKSIMKNGLSISGLEEFNVRVNASSNPLDAKGSDVIVITTKAYDTKNVLEEILPILDEEVNVMSLQNGAGNLEEIARFLKKQKIIGAVTNMGAFLESPGIIKYMGKGTTTIGPLADENIIAKDLVKIFKNAGIDTKYTNNIEREIWTKVIINSAINPLASILNSENGILLEGNLLEIVREVTEEGKMILKKNGIDIPEDIFEKTVTVIINTSRNINSTLSDLRKGNKTEIEFISGKIVELGDKIGIPAPYNLALLDMVKYKKKELMQKSPQSI